MKKFLSLTATLTMLSAPALADGHLASEYAATGDAAKGKAAFRQCQTCHVVQNDAGDLLAGRGAKVGPNLYGVVGRQAGSVDGFRYSTGMVAAGEGGIKWNEAEFVKYVQDPTPYLREVTGDAKARGKMAYKVRKEIDAVNLYAFLKDVGPAMEMEEAAAEMPAEAEAVKTAMAQKKTELVAEATEKTAAVAAPAAAATVMAAVPAGVAGIDAPEEAAKPAAEEAAMVVEEAAEPAPEMATVAEAVEVAKTQEVVQAAPVVAAAPQAPAADRVEAATTAGISKIEAAAAEAIEAIKSAADGSSS